MSTVNDQQTVTYQMAFSEVFLMFRRCALSPMIIMGFSVACVSRKAFSEAQSVLFIQFASKQT